MLRLLRVLFWVLFYVFINNVVHIVVTAALYCPSNAPQRHIKTTSLLQDARHMTNRRSRLIAQRYARVIAWVAFCAAIVALILRGTNRGGEGSDLVKIEGFANVALAVCCHPLAIL